jgi:hypothetical protein
MLMQASSTMRPSEKLALVDKIGRALQSKFGCSDIDLFLGEYNISPPTGVIANSKWVYAKEALKGVPVDTIIKIAEELGLEQEIRATHGATSPPRNWDGSRYTAFWHKMRWVDQFADSRCRASARPP